MRDKSITSILAPFALLGLMLSACSIASSQSAAQETYADPHAYCAAVEKIDVPDARYTGPEITDELFKDYLIAVGLDRNGDYPDPFRQMTTWRCMDKKVYVCNYGANIPCNSKANTDKNPTQDMNDFCTQYPDEPAIPMSVTGHNVIYSWHCVKDKPEILDQISAVDDAGYPANFWQLVEPSS